MGVVIAIFGLIHFFIFAGTIGVFLTFYKKENYTSKELTIYLITILSSTVIAFFIANQLALISDDPSVMMAIGYTVIPITQGSLAFLSYTIVNILNSSESRNIRYAPVLLGIITSAPVSLLATSTLSEFYWNWMGLSIYG